MAKPRRTPYLPLPLSEAFYAAIAQVAHEQRLPVDDLARVAGAVRDLSHVYTRTRDRLARPGELSRDALLARLSFFLPRDLVKAFGPLDDLKSLGRLPLRPCLRVLDLGAGLGSTTLGLARFVRARGLAVSRLQVTALERDRTAASVFNRLCRELAGHEAFAPIDLELRVEDIEAGSPRGTFDLILCGFALNELFLAAPPEERPALRARWLTTLSESLSPEGAMVILEPALKTSSRELMQVRDLLCEAQEAPFVLSPCVHDAPCPMLQGERDWCHGQLPYALTGPLAQIARAAELRYEGLSYAALCVGRRPLTLTARARGAVLYRIVSAPLPSKGKLELFGCGRPGLTRLSLLARDHSAANHELAQAERFSLLEVDSKAPRVSRNTQVRRARPQDT